MECIALDCHKKYTYAVVEDEKGWVKVGDAWLLAAFFKEGCHPGSPVAVETVGNRYWIVDEIEKACCVPRLVHAWSNKEPDSSSGKTRETVNRYLERAYSEAANMIARYHQIPPCGNPREKGPSESNRGGGKAPRGSHLVGAPHRMTLSGSGHLPAWVGDGGVNAAHT